MASYIQHIKGGLVAGIIYSILNIKWFKGVTILIVFVLAVFGGLFPDIMEPSDRGPRHRGIFHHLGFLALIILSWNGIATSYIHFLIMIFCSGYASHSLMDWWKTYREWQGYE